ncbi:MAG: MFS transporter [Lacunisphaera sp.]
MGVSMTGMVMLSQAHTFPLMCLAAGMMGMGSSVFHPEASRVARMASGGRHGFAQSLFQVGGNFGTSLGPLLAAAIIIPRGQAHILWFTLLAMVGIFLLSKIGGWYQRNMHRLKPKTAAHGDFVPLKLSRGKVAWAVTVLIVLVFSKYFYLISLTNYYTFYLMDKFHVSVQSSQIYLFVFLFAVAAGHDHRRAGGRSHRPQEGDLDFDPGRCAVLAAAAARRARRHGDPHGFHAA